MINFHNDHLELMLSHRNAVKKHYLLSATKQKLSNQLVEAGVMRVDEEKFVFNTEAGDAILDHLIWSFNSLVHKVKS
jgi:hypothetical protein